MKLSLHFTAQDWHRHERNWNAWWAGELDRPLIILDGADHLGRLNFLLDIWRKKLNLTRYSIWDLLYQPLPTLFSMDVPAEEVIAQYTRLLNAMRWFGNSWPRWWPNFGPGVAAAFLGARLHADPRTVWFDLPQPVDLAAWQPAVDPANPCWLRVQELTRLAREAWGSQVNLRYTDLGGNLDILASLRGTQQLLLDVLEAPQDVSRAVEAVTRAWLVYYNALDQITAPAGRGSSAWAPVWAPSRFYMLQSDFSYMISPRMFERFVLPDLAACCDALDYPFYHMDGKGQIPHLDLLLSLKKLRGIQWVPGDGAPDPEEWLPLLKRIRDGGKLCQLAVTPQGALRILRELGGKGFALYINEPMTPSQAHAFLEAVQQVS